MTIPLIIDDTPIVLFRVEQGRLLLTVQLFNADNEMLVQIVDNELVYSPTPWDIEFSGRQLTVRASGLRDIFARMTFEPPSRVVIDSAHVFRNGISVDVKPTRILLNDGNTVSGMIGENYILGVALGDAPRLGATVRAQSSRTAFSAHAQTERRVQRLIVSTGQ